MEQSGRQRCKGAQLRHRAPQVVRLSNPADSQRPDSITLHTWRWRPGMAEFRQTRGGFDICDDRLDRRFVGLRVWSLRLVTSGIGNSGSLYRSGHRMGLQQDANRRVSLAAADLSTGT